MVGSGCCINAATVLAVIVSCRKVAVAVTRPIAVRARARAQPCELEKSAGMCAECVNFERAVA